MSYRPRSIPFYLPLLIPIHLILLLALALVVGVIVLLSYVSDGLRWAVEKVKTAR